MYNSNLFSLLNLGAGAIAAQQVGVAVASNNIANVDTLGYSRQSVGLSSNLGAPLVGGVRVDAISRTSSDLLAGRIRDNAGASNLADAFAEAMLDLEGRMTSGDDLGARLNKMFASFDAASASPLDRGLREAAVSAARDLAQGIRRQAAEVDAARAEADARIRANLKAANLKITEIANANKSIGTNPDPTLLDKRDQAAAELTALVGGEARVDADGMMRFTLPGGEVLVDGQRASQFQASTDVALDGHSRIDVVDGSHRRNVTRLLGAGKVAGDVQFRDVDAAASAARLDRYAFDLAGALNTQHRLGAGGDGVAGRNLFAPIAAVDGAASSITIDAAIDADAGVLALGSAAAGVGSNTNGLALAALRDATIAGGGTRTLGDESIEMVADVGATAMEAVGARDLHAAQADSLAAMRDSLSGVSLQEEMIRLSQYQNAANAAMKVISVADEMMTTFLDSIR